MTQCRMNAQTQVLVPTDSPHRRAWKVWAIIGAVITLLVGTFGVSVGGASQGVGVAPVQQQVKVMVFGVTVHKRRFWANLGMQWWGLGLTGAFTVIGAATGAGGFQDPAQCRPTFGGLTRLLWRYSGGSRLTKPLMPRKGALLCDTY
jgi:hypothetical protein